MKLRRVCYAVPLSVAGYRYIGGVPFSVVCPKTFYSGNNTTSKRRAPTPAEKKEKKMEGGFPNQQHKTGWITHLGGVPAAGPAALVTLAVTGDLVAVAPAPAPVVPFCVVSAGRAPVRAKRSYPRERAVQRRRCRSSGVGEQAARRRCSTHAFISARISLRLHILMGSVCSF